MDSYCDVCGKIQKPIMYINVLMNNWHHGSDFINGWVMETPKPLSLDICYCKQHVQRYHMEILFAILYKKDYSEIPNLRSMFPHFPRQIHCWSEGLSKCQNKFRITSKEGKNFVFDEQTYLDFLENESHIPKVIQEEERRAIE